MNGKLAIELLLDTKLDPTTVRGDDSFERHRSSEDPERHSDFSKIGVGKLDTATWPIACTSALPAEVGSMMGLQAAKV